MPPRVASRRGGLVIARQSWWNGPPRARCLSRRLIVTLLVLFLTSPLGAVVLSRSHFGVLRDNAAQLVTDGAFAVTFSLYAGAEDEAAV